MEEREAEIYAELRDAAEFFRALGIEALPFRLPERTESSPGGSGGRDEALVRLRSEIGDCRRCKLSAGRRNIVFGEGRADARLMFIGEGPGKDEDIQGRPFVGEAGALLTKLIEKMHFGDKNLMRTDVYIANIVKCRPPMNRDPEEDEIASCRGFIERQIEIIRPEMIVTLGRIALQTLLRRPDIRITAARGNFFEYEGIPVMPTFHPAYLLRNPKDKWLTWSDAQKVMGRLAGHE